MNPNVWVDLYSDAMYSFALQKTGNDQLSEDLVQETFLSALKSAASFKGQSSERTWLFAILKFKIADHYRKAATKYEYTVSRVMHNRTDQSEHFFNSDGEWLEDSHPQTWSEDKMQDVEKKELGSIVNNCIEKLSEDQKQVILLKMVEEVETKIVCKELDITATNYWVLIHRAKLLLRACLEKNWFNA